MRPDEIDRFFNARAIGPEALAMAIHVRRTDRLIGTCALSQLDGDNGSALFHITIGEKDAWGHGYGTEATGIMVAHAFGALDLHRISLSVFAFNERAMRSYAACGFTVEGRAREAIWRGGRWWDEVSMSILEPEWRQRQKIERRRGRTQFAETGDPASSGKPPVTEAPTRRGVMARITGR